MLRYSAVFCVLCSIFLSLSTSLLSSLSLLIIIFMQYEAQRKTLNRKKTKSMLPHKVIITICSDLIVVVEQSQ